MKSPIRMHWDLNVTAEFHPDARVKGLVYRATAVLSKAGQVDMDGGPFKVLGFADSILTCLGSSEAEADGKVRAFVKMVSRGVRFDA